MKPELVQSSAPRPLANYSEAFKVCRLVFAVGKLASAFTTGVPPEASINRASPFYGSEDQAADSVHPRQPTRHLQGAGSSLQNIVKAQVFLTERIRRGTDSLFIRNTAYD